jgi:fumarylacetoacetate (FAA) hydrolase family protein
MFAPVVDRGAKGLGFTHKINDVVRVSSARLGQLENKVTTCDRAPRWEIGIGDYTRNLARRGLLA